MAVEHHPIILLGAARSGTKYLRSIIASSSAAVASPYDLNYLWRYGNENYPHDCLPASLATENVCKFIHHELKRSAGLTGHEHLRLVEKTVQNMLRVPFVYKVFPRARFVHIVRNGRDVVESAMRCWREPVNLRYLGGKLATFPWVRCAPYACKYFRQCVGRLFGLTTENRSWGPRYPGIDSDFRSQGLAYVCARQWQVCLHKYEQDRACLPASALLELRYEELVEQPRRTAYRLARWLELPDADKVACFAERTATGVGIGGGHRLPEPDRSRVLALLLPTLIRWGYDINEADGRFESVPGVS